MPAFVLDPDRTSLHDPGDQVVYLHGLHNIGSIADTYNLTWSSSQGWATVAGAVAGGDPFTLPGPVLLQPDQSAVLTVTITIPNSPAVRGLIDTTVITAQSTLSPTLTARVTDTTRVIRMRIYLPLILRNW
jgi:hypothetical protein